MFTLAEVRLLVEALGTQMAEYGETAGRVELYDRLRAERDRLGDEPRACGFELQDGGEAYYGV
jgi:hypothetical protein